MGGVAIIGAGIAGVRAAEALIQRGYAEAITIFGDEAPTYRPSASKEALKPSSAGSFPMPMKHADAHFTWKLGSTVEHVDLSQRSLAFTDADGKAGVEQFDGLIIASGLQPRALDVPGPTAGRYLLRTMAQARLLSQALKPDARVTIIGSGFIGCEVAAAAALRGCHVTVISPEPVPLASAVGDTIGAIVTERHRSHGVQFVIGQTVREYLGETRVQEVVLHDGTGIQTDLVLEAVGSTTKVDFLEGSGLSTVNGLLVNEHLRVESAGSSIFACGDIARHPNALFGSTPRRIEHWTVAADTGSFAGSAMHALLSTGELTMPSFAAVPSFWSDQYDLQIQSFGMPDLATEQRILEMADDGSCLIECLDGLGLVGVIGINRTAALARYRKSFNSRGQSTGLLSGNAQPH